jgi:hypothetical protein
MPNMHLDYLRTLSQAAGLCTADILSGETLILAEKLREGRELSPDELTEFITVSARGRGARARTTRTFV